MRRIVIAIGTTLSGLVLLFSWPTSLNRTVATAGASDATGAGTSSDSDDSGVTSDPGGSAAGVSDGTFVGASVDTRWGPVQVQITVADGEITQATAVEYPTANHRDQEINSYAIPVLEQETVDAQGDGVDMISGATVTSRGYVASLQDALDQAGL
jgi:uncharacterized protein with FMN-binding domain